MKNLPRWLGVLFIIFFLACLGLAGTYLLLRREQAKEAKIPIKVVSEIPQISVSLRNKERLLEFLQKREFFEKGAIVYGENFQWVKPERLLITLTPNVQEHAWVIGPDEKEPYRSFGVGYQDGEYRLLLHWAPVIWQKGEEGWLDGQLTGDLGRAILRVTKDPYIAVREFLSEEENVLLKDFSSQAVFLIEKKQKQGWLRKLEKLFVADVWAACGGSAYDCATWTYTCSCPAGFEFNWQCDPPTSITCGKDLYTECICSQHCGPLGSYSGPCESLGSEFQCTTPCTGVDCLIDNYCSWIPPAPTPPPGCILGAVTCDSCSVPCGGGTQTCNDLCSWWDQACNPQACKPNCLNLSGPSEISLGDTGLFSADFTSPNAELRGEIFYDLPGNIIQNKWFGFVTSGTIANAPWTPAAAGSYQVCCRAWNDAVAECRPPAFVDWPPVYACDGPGYCINVDVVSCEIEITDAILNGVGSSVVKFAVPTKEEGGTVDRVDFISGNPSVATVTSPDASRPFTTTITATGIGATTYTAVGTMVDEGGITCPPVSASIANITVNNPSAWWQVIGGDINAGIAGSGNIASSIPVSCVSPCEPVLIADNPAGYPGVPSAGSITPATGISSTNWQATGASYSGKEVYDYAFFEKKISASVTPKDLGVSGSVDASQLNSGGFSYGGYFWYRYDGSGGAPSTLTINGNVNLAAGRKVILFVKNASLVISGKVNVDDGTSTFIAIVNGDIIVDPSVGGSPDDTPELEGIYLADGQVKTGLGTTQLHIRGSVSGLGIEGEDLGESDGVVLERNLADNSQTPAELFEFAPDAMFLFPSLLSPKRMGWWKEVAP